jgi:adenosylmethionine-8-amino-7-oxononanoate aminotransferase
MPVATVPSPDCFQRAPGEDCEAHVQRCAQALEMVLEQRGHEICALILEPLVQCAGGMRMYPPAYLRAARSLCDRFQVHLIADEIAVGFGRTGTMFACEQADISPDFLCLSKGITGGYLPLSVVMTGEEVYDAFYADYREGKAFLHSHSYTGNPLACAAALASLDLFERDGVLLRNQETASRMAQAVAPLATHPQVADVRQTGMIVAIEMSRDGSRGNPYPSHERRGLRGYQHAVTRGVLLRPLGNVLYWMPPYVINDEEVRLLGEVTAEAVDAATRG